MEATANNNEAPFMSPTNGSVKKKFRARKTMTASCRLQLAALKQKNAVKEPSNKTVQPPEVNCETNLTAQDNPASKINTAQGKFSKELKVSIEVSQVDSGINNGCAYNKTWDGISQKSEDVPFSHTTHFIVRDFSMAATENHITGLDQVTPLPNTGSQVLSEDASQTAESTLAQDTDTEHEPTDIERSTIPENLNASITLKLIDEDEDFKKTSPIDDVTPAGPPDTNNAAVPENEPDPSNCATDGYNAPNSPSTLSAISDSVPPEQENDTAVGDCQKKRTCSESGDVPGAKRAKTSSHDLLDEIQSLIDRRINILFDGLFDQRVQTLTHQVSLVRRKGNHTDDIGRHLRNIKRLERRLKYAVHLQRQLGTELTPTSVSPEEPPHTDTTPDSSTVTPPAEAKESLPGTPPPAPNPELVVLSDNESEQASNPEKCQRGRPNTAAMQKIMESIKEHRKKARAAKTVIDLTDDEEQRCDKELAGPEHSASSSNDNDNSVENVFDKYSVKNDLPLSNNDEASQSCDVNEEKQPAPKSPPPPENLQESADERKTEADSLKPPQKTQLRLARVQNPKGIALRWNITHVDPTCAPAQAYCLYVHQGDPSHSKKLWKKIGEIKALPLPMACTLTQFVDDATYSFAMRAKDAKGRFGPLCDIQSTTLKPLGSVKKS